MANNKNSGELDKVQVVLLDLQLCFEGKAGRTPRVSGVHILLVLYIIR